MIIFGLMCAGLVLKLFQFLVSKLAASWPFFKPFWWWLVPWVLLMVFVVVRMETGRRGRRQNKADLEAGDAFCYSVEAIEAIAIQEQEDEGPGFFIKTSEGEVIFMQGQYLERYVMRQHFPWSSFEIVETPGSKLFLGLRKLGEPLKPSFTREPLSWEEAKAFGFGDFRVLTATDFESLKTKPRLQMAGSSKQGNDN
jgi:hypothetical protein